MRTLRRILALSGLLAITGCTEQSTMGDKLVISYAAWFAWLIGIIGAALLALAIGIFYEAFNLYLKSGTGKRKKRRKKNSRIIEPGDEFNSGNMVFSALLGSAFGVFGLACLLLGVPNVRSSHLDLLPDRIEIVTGHLLGEPTTETIRYDGIRSIRIDVVELPGRRRKKNKEYVVLQTDFGEHRYEMSPLWKLAHPILQTKMGQTPPAMQ